MEGPLEYRCTQHDFSSGPFCDGCGLHASTIEGGALSPEVISARLNDGHSYADQPPASPPRIPGAGRSGTVKVQEPEDSPLTHTPGRLSSDLEDQVVRPAGKLGAAIKPRPGKHGLGNSPFDEDDTGQDSYG